jgi:hypothetical protein
MVARTRACLLAGMRGSSKWRKRWVFGGRPLRQKSVAEVDVSFPLLRVMTVDADESRSPLLGALGRAYSRPFLDLFLFAQKTVDFGLHCPDAFLLPFRHRLSVFDKAGDQQVLKLRDPRLGPANLVEATRQEAMNAALRTRTEASR